MGQWTGVFRDFNFCEWKLLRLSSRRRVQGGKKKQEIFYFYQLETDTKDSWKIWLKCTFYWNDGDVYEGEQNRNWRNDEGVYYFFDGDWMEGKWEKD